MKADDRLIKVANGVNFRDLGGYPTVDGRTTKWQKLVRTGSLSQLNQADQQKLIDYGIDVDIDLRSNAERVAFPDQIPNRIAYHHCPLFDNDETESAETNERLQRLYASNSRSGYLRMLYVYRRLVINRQPQAVYRKLFSFLAAHGENQTVLFHCSAGKDRTGMVAILLLGILGIEPDVIRSDYLLTNSLSVSRVKNRVAAAKAAHMNRSFIKSLLDLSTVLPDYCDQAMAIINYEFGGIMAYLQDVIGISDQTVNRLRAVYLE